MQQLNKTVICSITYPGTSVSLRAFQRTWLRMKRLTTIPQLYFVGDGNKALHAMTERSNRT